MCIVKLTNKWASKMRFRDIQAIKICTAAFVLMVAKLWPPLLSLEWHWYLVIGLVAAILPLRKILAK